jgi:hypothetical protein
LSVGQCTELARNLRKSTSVTKPTCIVQMKDPELLYILQIDDETRIHGAWARFKMHLCRRLSHLTPGAPHAGAGGARSLAISDRISWNISRDTATSAIWNVT